MTMVFVASVPHTGTNTLEALLKKAGYEYVRRHSHRMTEGKTVWDSRRFPHDMKTIPLRSPQETWRSWKARGTMWNADRFLFAWVNLQNWVEKYAPIQVPIDIPEQRDVGLRVLHRNLIYEGEWVNEHRKGQRNWDNWRDLDSRYWDEIWALPMISSRYTFNEEFGPNLDLRKPA